MARKKKYTNAKDKREPGQFVTLAGMVLQSYGFSHLNAYALKLLMDLVAQYNGKNNGDLTMAFSIMQKRGWKSEATLNKYKRELLETGWIICTRQGGKNLTSLYAVTFFSIDECKGKLDVSPTFRPPSNWREHEPPRLAVKIRSPTTIPVVTPQ